MGRRATREVNVTDRMTVKSQPIADLPNLDDERWMADLPDDLGCLGLTGRDPGHARHRHGMDLGPVWRGEPKHRHRDVGI